MTDQDLKGKTALITGGNTEVAGEVALALSQKGVNISLCGSQPDLLKMNAEKIQMKGGQCITINTDINTLEDALSLVEKTRSTFGELDILIMVSPFWAGGHIHEHNPKTWELVLKANLYEPFLISRAVLPMFREQQRGEIMAIGSDSALGVYPQDGAYGVAMHALKALMELIRVENAEHGIRTHILSPGVASTLDVNASGQPSLSAAHVADWVIWLLTRPAHLRGNGAILI